jgi:type IV pilus assembly protein PilA
MHSRPCAVAETGRFPRHRSSCRNSDRVGLTETAARADNDHMSKRIPHAQNAEGEHGFTLIELLVVILIIGILAAIAIPSFLNQKSKASDAAAKELAHSMQVATETYATDHSGSYTGLSLTTLNQYESTIQTASGNGNAYATVANGSATGYTITAASTDTNTFSIIRTGGTTTRTCTPATGVNGGCVNGTW